MIKFINNIKVREIFLFILITIGFNNCGIKKEPKKVSSDFNELNIKFESYSKQGVFLRGKIILYNDSFYRTKKLFLMNITPVQIIAKSKTICSLKVDSSDCSKAYLVKVKYEGKIYNVFGKDLYEINDKQNFSFEDSLKNKYNIFPVNNFEMGAADDKGLTICDDFSVIIIENIKEKKYSFIGNPEKENNFKYAVLMNNDGKEEEIYKAVMVKDTLVVGIRCFYQEGGNTYNLKITTNGWWYSSLISDKTDFNEPELKKLEQIN